jgi:hypothetical protein
VSASCLKEWSTPGKSWGLLSNYQYDFWCHYSLVDHFVTLEEQARQAFLTKQHLVVVFLDTEKACNTAWQYRILWTLNHWKLKAELPIFYSSLCLIYNFESSLVPSYHLLTHRRMASAGSSPHFYPICQCHQWNHLSGVHRPIMCSLKVGNFAICYRSKVESGKWF